MADKKLMILGAGIYQVPLIKKAKARGLETIVVSVDGPYPGFALADKVYKLDTRDREGILKAARDEKIDGIMTTGTDVAMRAVGYVCDKMGLPGLSEETAIRLTDKAEMKKTFKAGGVSTSDFRVISLDKAAAKDGIDTVSVCERARGAAEELGYPVMVKACDVSGSRGITKVREPESLEDAVLRAASATHTDHLVIEKVNEGYEIGLDGLIRGGEVQLCLPHKKFVGRAAATTVPIGHGFPFEGSDALKAAIRREFEAIARAAGLTDGAINADVFVTGDDTVSVIEAGGRCGATTIPELITLYTGVDFYEAMIACALGEPYDVTPTRAQPCIGQLLLSPVDGVIKAIDTERIDAIRREGLRGPAETGERLPVVIELDYGPGTEVHALRNGTDRIGQIIVPTDDEAAVETLKRKVLDAIRIEPMKEIN